jgi:hypothetical protein
MRQKGKVEVEFSLRMAKDIFAPEEEESEMSAGNFILHVQFVSNV